MAEPAHIWLLSQPQASLVISGAAKLVHGQSNAQSAAWVLTPGELGEVNAILEV